MAEQHLHGGVVLVQRQIGDQQPFGLGLIQPGNQQGIALSPQGEDPIPHNTSVTSALHRQPAEALSAFKGLLQIKGGGSGEPGGEFCHG